MPNNKKKGGGGGKNKGKKGSDRAATLAKRADRRLLDDLPAFPGPETPGEMMERVVGYKYLSGADGSPMSIARGENGTVIFQEYTKDMEKGRWCELDPRGAAFTFNMNPDYDRNAADYPVARQIMEKVPRPDDDVTRKVKKCIGDVPQEQLDVFLKFMERGENVEVKCALSTRPLGGPAGFGGSKTYGFQVNVVGEEYKAESFMLFVNAKKGHIMSFSGCLDTKVLGKYQRELALLLSYECMKRVSEGEAELVGDLTPDNLVGPLSNVLKAMYRERQRWTNLACIESFRLERAIMNKSSLHATTAIECELGEALEACGFYSQAAAVYAEAAKYLQGAKHPATGSILCNTGLAWKRHGDYAAAESYYAASLNSMHFQYDHDAYRGSMFNTLTNLWMLYYDPVKDVAPIRLIITLRAMIIAAGHPLPGGDSFRDNGVPSLRSALQNASADKACRAIRFVAKKATSVESMREAILSFANPRASHIELYKNTDDDLFARGKDDAREYLQGRAASNDFLAACDGCGEVKAEKSLRICPCKNAYYCDFSCQKAHWPQHCAECKAARSKAKKKEGKEKK